MTALRRGFPVLVAGFLLLASATSCLVVVPLGSRAIYERLGVPVRILHPGLHATLPWPLGATALIEGGEVHALAMTGQTLLYRVGDSDTDAQHAAYATADAPALLRALGARAWVAAIAGGTVAGMDGASRVALAASLRGTIQAALDKAASGLVLVAVALQTTAPPEAPAEAPIAFAGDVEAERNRAAGIRSGSRQHAAVEKARAQAHAAEIVGAARVALVRFTADREAARAGGRAFLLDRYFTNLQDALGKSPMTIIDHRLNWPEAPVLDLRPLGREARPIDGKGD